MKFVQMLRKRNFPRERGAALILTVIVIMVLSSLGMAMVTFTTTEERTATTYRDALQTRAVAESGVRLVAEMFRSTDDRSLVPVFKAGNTAGADWDYYGTNEAETETQLNALGIWRSARPALTPARYTGASDKLFKGPFQDNWGQIFRGSYTPASDIYDLKFSCTNPATSAQVPTANCWLDSRFNALLAAPTNYNDDTGRITDISFYAPPQVGERAYGICTVRVTAEKRNGNNILARETIEAIIGDNTQKPSVMGNGDVNFKTQAGVMCGDGCEQIHANGNIEVGPISGGTSPMVTATGSVTGGSDTKANATALTAPEINPWDLTYKPTSVAELTRYYLLAARPLDPVWTTAGPKPAPRPCAGTATDNMSLCQDYNLEYDTAGNPKPPRSINDVPRMYRWNGLIQGWTQCAIGNSLNTCVGGPTFTVTRADDLIVSGTGDTADIPFNRTRVPQTTFEINTAVNGSVVLIDGRWLKNNAMSATMTVVAAGSITFTASSTWAPAMANRTMWITGRDLFTQSNCCAPSNTCATNLSSPQFAGIIAAHEQILENSQNALLGIMIAENRVRFDPTVNGTLAIDSRQGDHASLCGQPDWPWALPTRPIILAMRRATN